MDNSTVPHQRHASSLGDLPVELVELIVSYLDIAPPSFDKNVREPSLDLTVCHDQNLKNLSETSQELRRVVLPRLFKYSRLHLGQEDGTDEANNTNDHQPSYSKVRTYRGLWRQRLVKSETTLCPCKRSATTGSGDAVVSCSGHDAYLEFITKLNLGKYVLSLVISTTVDTYSERSRNSYPCCGNNLAGIPGLRGTALWSEIFSALNLSRIVLLAPPSSLASFLSARIVLRDAWAFDVPYQLLELRHSGNVKPQVSSSRFASLQADDMVEQNLLKMRRWEHVLLNEGSHVNAYSTYEYFLKEAPSIAHDVLTTIGQNPGSDDRCLSSFTYVSVFPSYTHVAGIFRHLAPNPGERALVRPAAIRTKLAPDSSGDFYRKLEGKVMTPLSDCWSEFDTSYSIIAAAVQRLAETDFLKSFSSGDYENKNLRGGLDLHLKGAFNSKHWQNCGLGAWERHDSAIDFEGQ